MLLNSSLGPLASNIRLSIVTKVLITIGVMVINALINFIQSITINAPMINMTVLGGAKAQHKRVNSGLGTQRTRAAKV